MVDMDYEEHLIRMKILSEELVTAKLKRKQEELKVKILTHQCENSLLPPSIQIYEVGNNQM